MTIDRLADYAALAVAVHGVALVVVNMTPSPRDNKALKQYSRLVVKSYRAIEIMAGIVSPLAKR